MNAKSFKVKLSYEPSYSLGYIQFDDEKVAKTVELKPFKGLELLNADYDYLGNLIGIEFITTRSEECQTKPKKKTSSKKI